MPVRRPAPTAETHPKHFGEHSPAGLASQCGQCARGAPAGEAGAGCVWFMGFASECLGPRRIKRTSGPVATARGVDARSADERETGSVCECGCERGNISTQLLLGFPEPRKFSSQAHVRVLKAAVLLLELRDPPIVEAKPLHQQRLERAALNAAFNAPPPVRIAPNDLRKEFRTRPPARGSKTSSRS